jgi:pyruvate/2-oxoglutarate/acetoin dehydrogenase E1 component
MSEAHGVRELAYHEARAEAVAQILGADARVFVMGGDMSTPFNPPNSLEADFPGRFMAPPIAELGVAGFGIGAAMVGLRPIVSLYTASFMFEAWPQVVNEAANIAYMSNGRVGAGVVFHIMHGLRGQGAAQHSASPQAMLWNAPGLKIVLPSSPRDVKGLLKTAVEDGNPVIFVDHLLLADERGPVPTELYGIPFGQAEVKRSGGDLTIVATSALVPKALEAARLLAAEGISAEVVDPRTLAPLDTETILQSVHKTGRVVVADECPLRCGVAAELTAVIAEHAWGALKAAPRRVARLDVPTPFSPPLEEFITPGVDKIVAAARDVLGLVAAGPATAR